MYQSGWKRDEQEKEETSNNQARNNSLVAADAFNTLWLGGQADVKCAFLLLEGCLLPPPAFLLSNIWGSGKEEEEAGWRGIFDAPYQLAHLHCDAADGHGDKASV